MSTVVCYLPVFGAAHPAPFGTLRLAGVITSEQDVLQASWKKMAPCATVSDMDGSKHTWMDVTQARTSGLTVDI